MPSLHAIHYRDSLGQEADKSRKSRFGNLETCRDLFLLRALDSRVSTADTDVEDLSTDLPVRSFPTGG